jgi:hypothetical protein
MGRDQLHFKFDAMPPLLPISQIASYNLALMVKIEQTFAAWQSKMGLAVGNAQRGGDRPAIAPSSDSIETIKSTNRTSQIAASPSSGFTRESRGPLWDSL